jgi:hypothetical protein
MSDKDNKVVNTEEQNRAVNPGTGDYQEVSPKESVGTNQALTNNSNKEENDKRNKPDKSQRAEE